MRGVTIHRILLLTLLTLTIVAPARGSGKTGHRPNRSLLLATAYSVEGTGSSGKWSHPGTVAADRDVLPLNSKIRIYVDGRYAGDYTVEDTGSKVDGHHIDIYMPSRAQAKKFGRKRVKVVILKFGDDQVRLTDPQQKAEAKATNRETRASVNAGQ